MQTWLLFLRGARRESTLDEDILPSFFTTFQKVALCYLTTRQLAGRVAAVACGET